MPEDVKREKVKVGALPEVRGPNFHEIYTNSIKIGYSAFDLRFVFGHMKETNDPEKPIVNEQILSTVMSPYHAKAFLLVLTRVLSGWEKEHGVIPFKEQNQEITEEQYDLKQKQK